MELTYTATLGLATTMSPYLSDRPGTASQHLPLSGECGQAVILPGRIEVASCRGATGMDYAWSPPARQRRLWLVASKPEITPPRHHIRDGTRWHRIRLVDGENHGVASLLQWGGRTRRALTLIFGLIAVSMAVPINARAAEFGPIWLPNSQSQHLDLAEIYLERQQIEMNELTIQAQRQELERRRQAQRPSRCVPDGRFNICP